MIPLPPRPKRADQPERPDAKYLPRHCPFLNKEVWAILIQQTDGTWKIVNCLDKDERRFEHHCAFTVDGGAWPFVDMRVDASQLKEQP